MWQQNHRAPNTKTVNDTSDTKFIKTTSNSKQRADRKHKTTHEDETAVFQKDRYRILTHLILLEQNNDHTRISH